MSQYSELCTADSALLGLGRAACGKVLGYDKRFFLTKPTFSFASAAAAKLEANWDAGIDSKDIFPFPEVQELESQNVEATFYETPAGSTFKTKTEKRKTQYKFIESIGTHAAMKSYSDREWNVFFITEKGYLRGNMQSNGTVKGLPISNFFVNAQETATIDSNPEQTPVVMEFEDVDDWDRDYYAAKISDSFLLNLAAPYELFLNPVVGTAGTTVVFIINVRTVDNVAVDGLLVGDFVLKDATGTAVTIDSATADGTIEGKYTVTATDTMTSGTIEIKDVVTKADVKYQSVPYAVTTA